MKKKAVFNWSSGKDSALCLYRILQNQNFEIQCLLTSVNKQYQRVSMHGVRTELLEQQAKQIELPLLKIEIPEMPTMEIYENIMTNHLTQLKNKGVTHAIFGDILLADLRKYREKQLSKINLEGVFPLWEIPTDQLVKEFIALGFKAIVTCVNGLYLDKRFVGRYIDQDFLNDLPENVDPCGENGEFHTFAFGGPLFKKPILFEKGEIVYRKYEVPKDECTTEAHNDTSSLSEYGFWYCDLIPEK